MSLIATFFSVIFGAAGCGFERETDWASSPQPQYYLEECTVRVDMSWNPNESSERQVATLDSLDFALREGIVNGSLPFVSYSTGAPYRVWWFFLRDHCHDRERVITGFLNEWIEETPSVTEFVMDDTPDLEQLDSRPGGWWKPSDM